MNIEWTLSGKVKEVEKEESMIRFFYDAMGNRVLKQVFDDKNEAAYTATWYSRDSSGNIMATYTSIETDETASSTTIGELNIFGSDRLGIFKLNKKLLSLPELGNSEKYIEKSKRLYELKNLPITIGIGNVISVISDRLLSTGPNSNNKVNKFEAETCAELSRSIVRYSDYYPFGFEIRSKAEYSRTPLKINYYREQMPDRADQSVNYRYGFNGIACPVHEVSGEKDKEFTNSTSHYDFGARIYDSRLGRWLAVDALFTKFPRFSPYIFSLNSTLLFLDADGRENIIYLVDLQGDKPTVLSNELIKEINSNFEKMGLKTKVVLFNNNWRSPDDFNSAYLDDSDSFVAVGAVNDVKKFMKKQLSEDDYDEYFKNWSGGNNVERGVNTGQGAAVDANSILSTKKNVENNDEIPTNAEWAAYLITHALGHNAGLNHNLENPRFGQMVENCAHMCSANLTKAFITDGNYLYTDDKGRKGWKTVDNSNLKTLSDFTNPDFNETYIEKMKEKFGEEEGQDNYNYNKSQEEFSLPNIVNKELLLGSENSQ